MHSSRSTDARFFMRVLIIRILIARNRVRNYSFGTCATRARARFNRSFVTISPSQGGGTRRSHRQSRNPLITKVTHRYFRMVVVINRCDRSRPSHTGTLQRLFNISLRSCSRDRLREKDPPVGEETTLMQHSWRCRQMKILDAPIAVR